MRASSLRALSANLRRFPLGARAALVLVSKPGRAQHDQGLDRTALLTEISVNLEIHMQRMWLDLCESGFNAANRTRISRFERQCGVLDTHGSSPCEMLRRGLTVPLKFCTKVGASDRSFSSLEGR
jgi:hypothetical protein